MASAWIAKRVASKRVRYRVMYRIGGRESAPRYGGSFGTLREANARKGWILGELAAMRVPDLGQLANALASSPTLREAAKRWQASRVDVADGTLAQQRISINRALLLIGDRRVNKLTAQDVADMIGQIHGAGAKPSYIRKVVQAVAMVLDHAGIDPNPARDKRTVRLPRENRPELNPPTAEHVLAVHGILPQRYRLPLLVLDATGMRVGELEALTWGDVDEPRGRWRVSQAVSKTQRGRWVPVPPALFEAVTALVAREDRTPERQVFMGFGANRFRTAVTRACIAAGVPAFSPHDLRHRRISLLHLGGVPWARIGEHVGQRNLATTANTYSHVMSDEVELDYSSLLSSSLISIGGGSSISGT
jgi:integrase